MYFYFYKTIKKRKRKINKFNYAFWIGRFHFLAIDVLLLDELLFSPERETECVDLKLLPNGVLYIDVLVLEVVLDFYKKS